jgi:hypothetical protein
MNLKTASLFALVGVALNLLIGLSVHLSRFLQGPVPPQVLLSIVGFLALNVGLLVFFTVLHRKQ